MYKKKSLLITFEGIEGSGKTFHSRKLYRKIKKMKLPVSLTREPGGDQGAEKIRKLILTGKRDKFDSFTDTLLYLASRNENFKKNIYPDLQKKKIVICDRFIDATIAYQVYGLDVDRKTIDIAHKIILGKTHPDFTFFLIINVNKSLKRVKKRKNINRYDKFEKNFYKKVQKGYNLISKTKKKNSLVLNTSHDSKYIDKLIFNKFLELIRK